MNSQVTTRGTSRPNSRTLRRRALPWLLTAQALFFVDCSCEDSGLSGIDSVVDVTPGPVDFMTPGGGACTAGSLVFDGVEIGDMRTQWIDVRNVGAVDLRITGITISGPGASEYSTDELTEDIVVPPNGEQSFPVAYAPMTGGDHSATVTITTDNGVCNTVTVNLSGAGAAGEIEVCLTDPAGTETCNTPGEDLPVDFGTVAVGETVTWNGVIKSQGSIPLRVRSITYIDGLTTAVMTDLPVGRAMTEDALFLEANTEHAFTLTYRPNSGRPEMGAIMLATNDGDENPVNIRIGGQGDAPAVCGEPLSLDLGDVEIGDQNEGPIRIWNCGTRPLDVSQLQFEDSSSASEFTLIDNPAPVTNMAPNDEFILMVRYQPTDIGPDTAAIVLTTTDPSAPMPRLSVLGRGVVPDSCIISVNLPTVNFGAVAGGITVTKDLLIINSGTQDCSVTELRGLPDGEFSLSGQPPLPTTISPGQNVTVTIAYAPADMGMDSATLSILSNDPIQPQLDVPIIADGGAPPECTIEIDPASSGGLSDGSLNFGEVNVGNTVTRTIKVRNRGTSFCNVSAVRIKCVESALIPNPNCDPPVFALSAPPVPAQLNPGQLLEIPVSFTPLGVGVIGLPINIPGFGTGSIQHQVIISTDDVDQVPTLPDSFLPRRDHPPGTFIVTLGGASVEADIEVIPGELDVGVITRGCRSPESCVTVYNVGSARLTVEGFAVEGANANVFTVSRVSTQAGGNVTFPHAMDGGDRFEICMEYRPGRDNGPEQATLVITSDDGNEPRVEVPLLGEATTSSHQTDVFQQLDEPKVDVLFVIDNSGSMGDEQSNVASNFQSFIGAADASNVDYHIGVISTEVNEAGGSGARGGIAPGLLFPGSSGDRIITRNTPNRLNSFQDKVNIGTCCSDEQEAGLKAAQLALSDPPPTENQGFIREDAKLSLIFVSDEQDQSSGPVDFYVDFFKAIKGFRNDALMDASSIVGPAGGCSGAGGEADDGSRYREVTMRTGGLFRSICTTAWGRDLADLGVLAFGVQVEFILSRQAIERTIEVRVNGQVTTTGWTYDDQTNSIIFSDTAVPERGAEITVDYDVVCIR